MTLGLGDVIAQIGGASVVREHTPLNVHVPTTAAEGVQVGEVTIPAGHVLAVEITTNAANWLNAMIGVIGPNDSWSSAQPAGDMAGNRATCVTAPGQEGAARIVTVATEAAFTVTGLTTTLIPT